MKQENTESKLLEMLCTTVTDDAIRVADQMNAAKRCGLRSDNHYLGDGDFGIFRIKYSFPVKRRYGLQEGTAVITVADAIGKSWFSRNPVNEHFAFIRYPLFADMVDSNKKMLKFYEEIQKVRGDSKWQ